MGEPVSGFQKIRDALAKPLEMIAHLGKHIVRWFRGEKSDGVGESGTELREMASIPQMASTWSPELHARLVERLKEKNILKADEDPKIQQLIEDVVKAITQELYGQVKSFHNSSSS